MNQDQNPLDKDNQLAPERNGDPSAGQDQEPKAPPASTPSGRSPSEKVVSGGKTTGQPESLPLDIAERRRMRAEQREMLSAVSSYFRSAHIDQFIVHQGGGAQYSDTLGPPPVTSDEISQDEIDRVAYVYEKPHGFDTARRQLETQHLVILQGPMHTGKRAAGIRMALETLGENVRIEELSPETSLLERIKAEYLQQKTTYLIDGLVSSRAEKLLDRDWEILVERLKNEACYLVVCITNDVRLSGHARGAFCHTLKLPEVSTVKLVENHIEHLLAVDHESIEPEAIKQCLADERVQRLMTEKLAPGTIFHLATLLSRHLKECGNLETALHQFSTYAEDLVQEWFEECGDNLDERAFRIALAVFNGARYSSMESAARDLAERLKPEPQPDEEKKTVVPEPHSPFAQARKRRLERARAHLETAHIPTEYSDQAEVQIVCLNDPNYQYALIKYLWEEYGEFQQTFLEWLSAHAVRHEADIRQRAAAAAGALAQIDFERIRMRLLVPWALMHEDDRDSGRRFRAALSTALLILIWDDHRAVEVRGLLRYWAAQKRIALKWAAVRAYAAVGLRYPQEAMEVWRSIIDDSEGELYLNYETLAFIGEGMLISLVDAIVNLFTGAFEWPDRFHVVYEQLLEAIKNWVQMDRQPKSKSRLGLPVFLLLMNIPMPMEDESQAYTTRPPALLSLFDAANPNSPALDHLVWLLRQALNEKSSRLTALDLIHNWFNFVDNDNNLKPSLTMIIQTLLKASDLSQRERERLQVYFNRWSGHPDDDKKSKIAKELLDQLDWSAHTAQVGNEPVF